VPVNRALKVGMDSYSTLFSGRLAAALSCDAALAELRVAGASPIEAIKAIHFVLNVGLGEAKEIFSRCPAWAGEVKVAIEMHDELLAHLQVDRKN
jgi:ribosomal protein L7/L12